MQNFERQCGIGQGLGKRLGSKSYATTFKRIENAYPQLNIQWLKTGEGEMLNSADGDVITQNGGRQNIGKVVGNVDQREGTFNEPCPDDAQHILKLEKEVENLRALLAHKDDLIAELRNSAAKQDARIAQLEKTLDYLMKNN